MSRAFALLVFAFTIIKSNYCKILIVYSRRTVAQVESVITEQM